MIERSTTDGYAVWFRRVVWAGVIVNFALAVPAVAVPERLLALLGVEPTGSVWVRFAAWLLMLLSLFYVPGANDPFHYRANAWLAVFARLAGTAFFFSGVLLFGLPRAYLQFGLIDLAFAVPQGILLALAMRGASTRLEALRR
jgi:hypothetical protein